MATMSFNDFLKKAGGSTTDVKLVGNQATSGSESALPESPSSPGFADRIRQDFTQRNDNIDKYVSNYKSGKESFAGGVLDTAGQIAGGVGDIIGEAVKSVTPQPIKDAVSSAVTSVANMKPVKAVAQKYADWKSANPIWADHLENALNIGSILPVAGGAKAIEEVGGQAVTKALETAAPVAENAISKTGKVLKTAGEAAYKVSVPMDEPTKLAMQAYEAKQPSLFGRVKNFITDTPVLDGEGKPIPKPITETETAARQGLAGTEWQLGVQAKKASGDLWNNIIAPKLNEVKGKINMQGFLDEVRKDIVNKTPELSRRNSLLEGLDALKEEYNNIGSVKLTDLQNFKEGWAKFLPEATYKGKPIASALKEVKNMAADKARWLIYNHIGDAGKQAYLDYGNLQTIMEAGRKSVDLLRSKGWTKQAWEAIMDKTVTPVATFAGKVLYKMGDGLELMGNKGAKQVRDVIEGVKDIPTKLNVKSLPSDFTNPNKAIDQFNKPIKLLPSPSYMEMGPQTVDTTMKVQDAKRISIRQPKTGKFDKAYTSEIRQAKK